MSCTEKIAADILRDCDNNPPVKGLEQNLLIINWEDLAKSGISLDASNPKELIDGLTLNSGTSGFLFEGIQSKQNIKHANEFVTNENTQNGLRHILPELIWADNSKAGRAELNKMKNGRFYIISERLWKGADSADAFLFYGYLIGLEMVIVSDESNENDGLPVVTFQTPEGFYEPNVPHLLLDTDYATTKTAFGNKFAQA
ncbi:hypothetical protein [Ekhidna sp.]